MSEHASRSKEKIRLVMETVEVLKSRLQAALGDDVDPEMLSHTIEGETDFFELLAKIIRDAEEEQNVAASLKKMMDDMRRRYERMMRNAEKKKEIVREAMDSVGHRERHYPDMSIYVSNGRAPVYIPDETKVPDTYCRIRKEPDRAAIRETLEGGLVLDFAEYGPVPRILTVRTK